MDGVDPDDPALLDGLAELDIAQVRARRAACQAVETDLSYVRRLVQGRLDIVQHELAQRQDGGSGDADLVDHLATVLADRVHAPGNGHLPTVLAPGDVDPALLARLEELAPAGRLSDPHQLSDDELQAAAEALAAFEREVSGRRRALFDRIDALQEEIVRRYRTGEASVDAILQAGPG